MNRGLFIRGFVFVVLVVLISNCVFSDDKVRELFQRAPTSEGFQALDDPTLNDFERLPNPSVEDFKLLSREDRESVLLKEYRAEFAEEYLKEGFSDPVDNKQLIIAHEYFTSDSGNINSNKEMFMTYMKKGHGVNINMVGDVDSFNADGLLNGASGSINVLAFKDDFDFEVDADGNIVLIEKNGQKHNFKGVIEQGKSGNMRMDKGSIDGIEVVDGQDISFEGGRIKGNFREFNGIKFKNSAFLVYDDKRNLLTSNDAEIVSVDSDVKMNIRGKFKVLDYEEVDGDFSVLPGDKAEINGLVVNNFIASSGELKLPSRGYFKGGDSGKDVILLQQYLVEEGFLSSVSGSYDSATESAVKSWQEDQYRKTGQCLGSDKSGQCNFDALFGSKSLGIYTTNYNSETIEEKPVALKFGNEGMLSFFSGDDDENYVRFGDEIMAEGEGFDLSFSPKSMAKKSDSQLSRSSYKKGDKATLGSAEYNDIALIQKIVGASQDGDYGRGTEAKVKEWQIANGLESTGVFGDTELAMYKDTLSESVVIEPKGGKVYLEDYENSISFSVKGDAEVSVDGDAYVLGNHDVSIRLGKSLLNGAKMPVDITLYDDDGQKLGSYERDYTPNTKPIRMVKLGGKDIPLRVGEAYVVTSSQTAFTEAVAPDAIAPELESFDPALRDEVLKAGHMAIIYVDESGEVRVSESDWAGVSDRKFEDSHIYDVRNSIVGVYEYTNADSSQIIKQSQIDSDSNIGWFFTDIENPVLLKAANVVNNADRTEYRSCLGHVSSVSEAGGVDLEDNAIYLSMQNNDVAKLEKYISSYGLKGISLDTIVSDPQAAKALEDAGISLEGDKITTEHMATGFQKVISGLDTINKISTSIGLSPQTVTPSQLVYGNLKSSTLEPVSSVSVAEIQQTGTTLVGNSGYEGDDAIKSWKADYNKNCVSPCTRLKEDNTWSTEAWIAYNEKCELSVASC